MVEKVERRDGETEEQYQARVKEVEEAAKKTEAE